MFNLEQAIAEWRKRMLSAGVKAPVPLDELEVHLRDELERTGAPVDQKIFETAVRQLGDAEILRGEFRKVKRSSMKRKLMIGAAVSTLLVGTSIILPALAQHKIRNKTAIASGENYFSVRWATDEIVPLCIGFALAFGAIAGGVHAVKGGRRPQMS